VPKQHRSQSGKTDQLHGFNTLRGHNVAFLGSLAGCEQGAGRAAVQPTASDRQRKQRASQTRTKTQIVIVQGIYSRSQNLGAQPPRFSLLMKPLVVDLYQMYCLATRALQTVGPVVLVKDNVA